MSVHPEAEGQPTQAAKDLVSAIQAVVRLEISRAPAALLPSEPVADQRGRRVMLSIQQMMERYGVGRKAIRALAKSGRLPCSERKCRGGRMGIFVHLAVADRVLGGMRA
jgi:hypothetical protein